MTHLFPLNRALGCACVVPLMQHWFVVLKYTFPTSVVIISSVLEVVFQWEVLANIGEYKTGTGLSVDRMARGLALTMLLSHWCYIAAFALGKISSMCGASLWQVARMLDDEDLLPKLTHQTSMERFENAIMLGNHNSNGDRSPTKKPVKHLY